MDKVLKQRLIGATILIALAVIFIPMLFDAPEEVRPSRDLTIDLPDPPADRAQVRRMPLDADQARQVPPESAAEAPPRTIEPEISRPVPESQPELVVPEPVPESELEPDSEAVDEPMIEPEAIDEPDPILEPFPEPEMMEGWLVQVASFGTESTAREIAERLEGLGHEVSVDRLVRGQAVLHRVRTGPYSDRMNAERARDQIERTVAGVDPVVRQGERSQTVVTAPGFAVQVGSFASRDNALRLLSRLDEHGFEGFIHAEEVGSRTIWRVRAGLSETREQAEQVLDDLLEQAGLEGLVVSHP